MNRRIKTVPLVSQDNGGTSLLSIVYLRYAHMKKAPLLVDRSGIHGYGVFSRSDIKKGKFIAELNGSRIFYETTINGQSNRYENWIGIGKNKWIDPVDEFQYLNHSCNPNAGFKGSTVLKLYALRDISPGEEITIDYATTEEDPDYFFENMEPEHPFHRKYVGPIQSLPREVFERYLPFIPTYFIKVYKNTVLLENEGSKELYD